MRANRKYTDSEMRGSVGDIENMELTSVQPTSILSSLNSRQSQMAPTEKASTNPFQKDYLNTSTGMQTDRLPSTMHPTRHFINWQSGLVFHSSLPSMIQTSGVLMSIHLGKKQRHIWRRQQGCRNRILSGCFTRSECVRQKNPSLGN